jgi:virulence factor Mce-like protein
MSTIERQDLTSSNGHGPRQNLTWRQRMEIVPGRHRPKRVRNGAIFVAAVMIFLWIIYTKPTLPFLGPRGTTVTADLGYGANIRPGYTPVRVHGVDVGQVTSVARPPSGRGVRVKLLVLDGKGVKLHRDASLSLRWRTLLGRNMYIDLNPGSPTAPALAGDFIPRGRSSDQVELDTALEPLNATGRRAVQTMIDEFDSGFADPRAFAGTLDAAGPALRDAARGLRPLTGTQPDDLSNLVSRTSRALGALARNEQALGGVLDNGRVAVGATAARRADLAATVNTAPAALRDTRTTMARLRGTLDALDPLADKLKPGVGRLAPAAARAQAALHTAVPLLRDLRPTLHDLSGAVRDLDTAATAGTPSFGPLTTTIDRVHDVFLPWLHATNPESRRPNYQDIGPAVASVSSATSWGDKNGPVANFEAAAGENALIDSPCTTAISNPSATQQIQCELLTRSFAAALTGQRPQDLKVPDSAVPRATLLPFLTGHAQLKPHPHQKPLHLPSLTGRAK